MPSALPLPSVLDLERAFHASVGAERKTEDSHVGSFYDRWAGVGALCMRRMAERDQGEARAIFFDTATDSDLDQYIEERFGAERTQDTSGTGAVALRRPSATAGAGTILKGTRIAVGHGNDRLQYWLVSQDWPVGATDLVSAPPVIAAVTGHDGQVALEAGQVPVLRVEDPLWDNTWTVSRLDCAAGTTRQVDSEVRGVIRQSRLDGRPGFETSIIKAMVGAGASVVVLYQSDYLGDTLDFGLNRIYVGNAGYQTPAALLTACRLAVPSVCVAGTSVQVLALADSLLYVSATVRLWQEPNRFSQEQYQSDAQSAIVEYFNRRDNAFLWSAGAIRTAVMKVVPNVRSVDIVVSSWIVISGVPILSPTPEPDPVTLFDNYPLPRYRVADWTVTATIAGPG